MSTVAIGFLLDPKVLELTKILPSHASPSPPVPSRFGVRAVSNSVLPPGVMGRPPSPSATSMTILESFLVCNSRVKS